MKIRYNLDSQQFTRKPDAKKDAPKIRVRLCAADHIVETDPAELLDAIEKGQTFTPAEMTGTKGSTWQSQQIVCVDIDNENSAQQRIERPLFPDSALSLMSEHKIIPYCMYYSFSHKEDHPKYRIMVILSEPIRDAAEAKDLTERLTAIFNKNTPECADEKTKDNARLFYGSRSGAVFYKSGTVTPLDTLRSLPPIRENKDPNPPEKTTGLDWNSELPAEWSQYNTFDLRDPLSYIPADDYDIWVKCGMALKTEGYSLEDWKAWSRTSSKYNEGDCEKKWNSFSAETARPITGAYITGLAKDYGYISPKERAALQRTSQVKQEKVTSSDKTMKPENTSKQDVSSKPEEGKTDPVSQEPQLTSRTDFDDFLAEIMTDRFEPISTGIDQLDKALSGGLERKTLVTLAAAPGAGKTAIAQYLLENMAEKGHNVVYVNLEMDRSQLLSRSIARLSHERSLSDQRAVPMTRNHLPQSVFADISAIDVRRGYKWTDDQKAIVEKTAAYYREHIAPHFQYVTTNPENRGSIDNTLSSILRKLEAITAELIRNGENAPLVCIDYLQFVEYDLLGEKERKPDNAEAIKQTLKAFKQFAMKYNTVVILITANNRASNSEGRASMDSARDTSNIEYSGDVMLSLVYTAVEDRWTHRTGKTDRNGNDTYAVIDNDYINHVIDWTLSENKSYPDIAKRMSLKVVKGRGIQSRGVAKFKYDGRYFYFEPDTDSVPDMYRRDQGEDIG